MQNSSHTKQPSLAACLLQLTRPIARLHPWLPLASSKHCALPAGPSRRHPCPATPKIRPRGSFSPCAPALQSSPQCTLFDYKKAKRRSGRGWFFLERRQKKRESRKDGQLSSKKKSRGSHDFWSFFWVVEISKGQEVGFFLGEGRERQERLFVFEVGGREPKKEKVVFQKEFEQSFWWEVTWRSLIGFFFSLLFCFLVLLIEFIGYVK